MGQVLTKVHESDNGLTFERIQDVEPIMQFAHNMRAIGDIGSNEMRHAASIPMVLVEAYCNDKHITFEEFMADTRHVNKMLNDPALKAFRIWEGRV
jgi:hypothetical protein